MRELASQRGSRWRQLGAVRWLLIEQLSEDTFKHSLSNLPAEEELGVDHFEGRSWRGLHHHITLCFLAFCLLTLLRASKKTPLVA